MIDLNRDYRMTIDGKLLGAAQTFPAFNPATRRISKPRSASAVSSRRAQCG